MNGESGRVCSCATDGSAARCPFHTQADYEAAQRRCTCCLGLMYGESGDLCGPCQHMGCVSAPARPLTPEDS